MQDKAANDPCQRLRDFAPVWLAKLERALEEGDFESAVDADAELRRLGVKVTFLRPGIRREESP